MDKKQRFTIFSAIHRTLDWSSIFAWYGILSLPLIYRPGQLIWAALCFIPGFAFLLIDYFTWRPFAVEYAIYRCLEHNESLNDNLPLFHDIEFRYVDYLELKNRRKYLNPAVPGAIFYCVIILLNGLNHDTVSLWAAPVAIIIVAITAIIAITLIAATFALRFRRRHNHTFQIPVYSPDNRHDYITVAISRARRYY